jgi:ubiquinone/menaquinone biosynthesis C-methylase UbiE
MQLTVKALDGSMRDTLPTFLATDPDAYEQFMGRWSARLAEPFLDFAGVSSGGQVLDVGCGTGTISLASAKRGAKTTGLDTSELYLAGARRLRSHTNVAYEHGDACHLQYSDNSFDACVSAGRAR